MCRLSLLIEAAKISEDQEFNNMLMPAITLYHYARNALVHPYTEMMLCDHVFSFKTKLDNVEGDVVIIQDNGRCYGFVIREIYDKIDNWYTRRYISNEEHHEIVTYFQGWINGRMPVCALDQITSCTRNFTYNSVNWLMMYVNRVDLRGMIPPEWFYSKIGDRMKEFDDIIAENINPVFLPPPPRALNEYPLNGVFDDLTVSTLDLTEFDIDDNPTENN